MQHTNIGVRYADIRIQCSQIHVDEPLVIAWWFIRWWSMIERESDQRRPWENMLPIYGNAPQTGQAEAINNDEFVFGGA